MWRGCPADYLPTSDFETKQYYMYSCNKTWNRDEALVINNRCLRWVCNVYLPAALVLRCIDRRHIVYNIRASDLKTCHFSCC